MLAHARVFLDLVERAAGGYEHADQVSWLARVGAEEVNVLVAIDRSLDLGQSSTAACTTWFMWLYWWLRGQVSVGRRLAGRCLSTELLTWARSRAHLARATMAYATVDRRPAGGGGELGGGGPRGWRADGLRGAHQGPDWHRPGRAGRGDSTRPRPGSAPRSTSAAGPDRAVGTG